MEKPVRPKVNISEHRVLVDPSKSKKLATLANKSTTVLSPNLKVKTSLGLASESDTTLQQAQQRIDTRIHEILNSFPEGRRNKLFNLRFGSIDDIKALEIKIAFKKLGLASHDLNMRLLVSLNYYGETV